MKRTVLDLPIFGLAVATRVALGTGIGLLASAKMRPELRRRLGVALVAVGAATTVPVVRAVLRGRVNASKESVATA